jgi:hypothetical protein
MQLDPLKTSLKINNLKKYMQQRKKVKKSDQRVQLSKPTVKLADLKIKEAPTTT